MDQIRPPYTKVERAMQRLCLFMCGAAMVLCFITEDKANFWRSSVGWWYVLHRMCKWQKL